MNSHVPSPSRPVSSSADPLSRREAIRRATLLLGVALSPSLVDGVLRAQDGRLTNPGQASDGLSSYQLQTLAAVAERIIPRTDTPGAIDVGVPAFIDLMYREYLTLPDRGVIAAGLADVEKRSQSAHGKAFAKLAAAQQDSLLTTLARESQKRQRTFFHQMRELTVLGYYTSEEVGKNVLHYDPVPGAFASCVPISEVGNVNWTK